MVQQDVLCRAVPLTGEATRRSGWAPPNRCKPDHRLRASTSLRLSDQVMPRFVVVGVGASAGGLEALSDLLANLPEKTGMAVVVVQHLDPQHESKLSNLLSRVTHLPVLEATQDLAVQPDHVYVIPRNMTMTIAQGVLQLAPAAGFAARTCRSTCS